MAIVYDLVLPPGMEPPPRLYHYTSQRGLLGILSSKTIWATRIQFLNDSTELGYSIALWQEAVQFRIARLESDTSLPSELKTDVLKILRPLSQVFNSASKASIYVACFSEDGDTLSQWRGYCPGGHGYSIGFNSAQIIDATPAKFFLAPCIYDKEKQVKLMDELLLGLFADCGVSDPSKSKSKAEFTSPEYRHAFVMQFFFLASLLKHPSFFEEREWRLISSPISDDDPQIDVRESKFVLIPHFKFELVKPEEELDVEVVVGPNPEAELAMTSLSTLLKTRKCRGSSRLSSIPFREI